MDTCNHWPMKGEGRSGWLTVCEYESLGAAPSEWGGCYVSVGSQACPTPTPTLPRWRTGACRIRGGLWIWHARWDAAWSYPWDGA
eukprot:6215707-Prymnesium_polylepis.1